MALVLAKKFFTSIEASLAQSYLGSEGVDSYLFDVENSWDTFGRIAIPVRLMVDEADLARTTRLLDDIERRPLASEP